MSATRSKPAWQCVGPLARGQRGASMITAVFLITALAVLGAMMTRMITLGSKESVSEWYSAQALYAAESGVDWAARYIEDNNSCAPLTTSDRVVVSGRSWFDIDISCAQVDALLLYTITSTGKAGGSAVSPVSQRQLQVVYSPAG